MALVLQLTNAGLTVKHVHTAAKVHFEKRDGRWSEIDLDTEASISNVTAAAFEEYAQNAKTNCPVRHRHPSASQAPLSSSLRYGPNLHFSLDAQVRW
jgi:hypothetical protein